MIRYKSFLQESLDYRSDISKETNNVIESLLKNIANKAKTLLNQINAENIGDWENYGFGVNGRKEEYVLYFESEEKIDHSSFLRNLCSANRSLNWDIKDHIDEPTTLPKNYPGKFRSSQIATTMFDTKDASVSIFVTLVQNVSKQADSEPSYMIVVTINALPVAKNEGWYNHAWRSKKARLQESEEVLNQAKNQVKDAYLTAIDRLFKDFDYHANDFLWRYEGKLTDDARYEFERLLQQEIKEEDVIRYIEADTDSLSEEEMENLEAFVSEYLESSPREILGDDNFETMLGILLVPEEM